MKSKALPILLLLLCPFATAWGDAFLDQAMVYWEKGDLGAAMIETQNARQLQPANPAAFMMLARIYLDLHRTSLAKTELRRAQKYGIPAEQVLPLLGKALLQQQAYEVLLQKIQIDAITDDKLLAQLLTLRGQAYAALGKESEAKTAFKQALELDPMQPDALMIEAIWTAGQSEASVAREILKPMLDDGRAEAWAALAKIEAAAGDFAAAENALTEAMSTARVAWPYRFQRALMRLEQGNLAGSNADYKKVRTILPDFQGLDYFRGRLALANGEPERALKVLTNHLTSYPLDKEALFYAANAAVDIGRLELAERHLDKLLITAPETDSANWLLGLIKLGRGDAKGALDAFVAGKAQTSHNIKALRGYIMALTQLGRTQEAQQAWQSMLQLIVNKARIELASGQENKTIETLHAMTQNDSELLAAHTLLAKAELLSGSWQHALDALKNALTLDRQGRVGMPLLERFMRHAGALNEQRALLDSLLALNPQHEALRFLRARMALLGRDYSAALPVLAELGEQYPDRSLYSQTLIQALAESGDHDGAIAESRAWLLSHPQDQLARLRLAALLVLAQEMEQARAVYEQILVADPNQGIALNNLANLISSSDRGRAIELAQRAIATDPGNAEYLDTLGVVLLAEQDTGRARQMLADAHRLAPGNAAIALHYAQALIASGEIATARLVLADIPGDSLPYGEEAKKLLQKIPGA